MPDWSVLPHFSLLDTMLQFLWAKYPLQRWLGNKPVIMVSGESAGLQKNKKYTYIHVHKCLKLAQQMGIDSFWWILALISDQTVYKALNQNVYISLFTLIQIWICSFWIMSTYDTYPFFLMLILFVWFWPIAQLTNS